MDAPELQSHTHRELGHVVRNTAVFRIAAYTVWTASEGIQYYAKNRHQENIAHNKGKYSPQSHREQRQQQQTNNKQHTSWTVNGTVKDAPKGWSSPGTPMGAGV